MQNSTAKKNLDAWIDLWRKTDSVYTTLLKRWGLSLNGYFVLDLLNRNPEGVEPAVIAEEVNIMRQLVTIIINEFESKNYIIRHPLTSDHRRKKIILTPTGKEFAHEVLTQMLCIELEGMTVMSEAEQSLLIELSQRYYNVINAASKKSFN